MDSTTTPQVTEDDLLTVRIRNGKEVIARWYGEDLGTWIFYKRPKAEALAKKQGTAWEVCSTPSGRIFYVARKETHAVDYAA